MPTSKHLIFFLVSLSLFFLTLGLTLGQRTTPKPTSVLVASHTPISTGQLYQPLPHYYTSKAQGYQIYVPTGWLGMAPDHGILDYSKRGSHITIRVSYTSQNTIQGYLKDLDQHLSRRVLSSKTIKIGVYSAVKRQEQWMIPGIGTKTLINTYFLHLSHVYSLTLDSSDSSTWAESDYNQILSSFKFTN